MIEWLTHWTGQVILKDLSCLGQAVLSLSKKLYTHCSVLSWFQEERIQKCFCNVTAFCTIELKKILYKIKEFKRIVEPEAILTLKFLNTFLFYLNQWRFFVLKIMKFIAYLTKLNQQCLKKLHPVYHHGYVYQHCKKWVFCTPDFS